MTVADVGSFLLAVEDRMRADIARTPAAEPARALLDAGGKRLRVRLLFCAAQATASRPVEPDDEALVRAAAAIEFAHLGSLIHDDIADSSDTRRGVPTVHRRHDIATAVDTGTALAHLASEMVATLGRPARRAVRRAILATCRGQIRELVVPCVLVSPRARLAIMQEKTAAFFELAAALGAIVGGATLPHRAAVCRFARRFGVAFQIADDVFDLAGDPRELGRPNGADLREGVSTLPLLLAANEGNILREALASMNREPSSQTIATCAELIARGGGIAAATEAARWWLEQSLRPLAALPAGEPVADLAELARASVTRGLRCGNAASYVVDADAPLAAFRARSAWVESIAAAPPVAGPGIDPHLRATLDWFHPGIAALVCQLARVPAVARSRNRARAHLTQHDTWSAESLFAGDAIALAYAIGKHALEPDPPRTLALVDALYCLSIGALCRAANPVEHERMAARARTLLTPRRIASTTSASSRPPVESPIGVSLSA